MLKIYVSYKGDWRPRGAKVFQLPEDSTVLDLKNAIISHQILLRKNKIQYDFKRLQPIEIIYLCTDSNATQENSSWKASEGLSDNIVLKTLEIACFVVCLSIPQQWKIKQPKKNSQIVKSQLEEVNKVKMEDEEHAVDKLGKKIKITKEKAISVNGTPHKASFTENFRVLKEIDEKLGNISNQLEYFEKVVFYLLREMSSFKDLFSAQKSKN